MPYLGPGIDNGFRSRFIYTATAGQTSFSGGDANGITLTYTDSEYLDVYQNGVLLVPGDDYAATTGTTVVLVQGASLNDKVEMIQYQAFGVADTVSRADGGAFGGNISTSGTLAVTGNTTVGGTLGVTGIATFTDDIIIGDGKTIGSASDVDAITISSGGVVTLSASAQRAQTFVLQADEAGDGAAQTLTNLAEQSGDYTRLGAANFSHSSGIFSSATTGTFLCLYNISVDTGDAQDGFDFRIEISTNSGSNFTGRAVGYTEGGSAGGPFIHGSNQTIFTVSNTTTFRLRFRLGAVNSVGTNNEILGDANQAETSITFIKLGVI